MYIAKESSLEKNNSLECTVWEYPFPSNAIGVARVKINGRYPSKGKVLNKNCDLVYYILSGKGVILTGQNKYQVAPGDSVFLEKGVPYFVEGDSLEICLSSAPAWYFEQYEEVG